MKNHIKIADLQIPKNIWELTEEERKELVITVKEFLETLVDRQIKHNTNKKVFMVKLLESTIIVNEQEEQYEICQIIKEIKDMIE